MINPKVEMQLLAGKVAVFLAGVYLTILFGAVVTTVNGRPVPLIGWALLLLPAAAFAPSFLHAVQLHRTSDDTIRRALWWRSLALALIGLALAIAAALIVGRVERA